MFGFMKKHSEKDKEEKERKKREKEKKKLEKKAKDKGMTQEELQRLEEAKQGLFRNSSDASSLAGHATAYRDPNDSDKSSEPGSSREESMENIAGKYKSQKQMELTKPHKPAVMPKPERPKRGILKGKSSYGPEIPNQGVRGNVDDTRTLEANTIVNELLSGKEVDNSESISMASEVTKHIDPDEVPARPAFVKTDSGRTKEAVIEAAAKSSPPKFVTPPPPNSSPPVDTNTQGLMSPPSPSEKTFGGMDLKLPSVAPPRIPQPRDIILKRQPAGDFGFTLRRGSVLERGVDDSNERKRMVIFAEPGPKNNQTGLLPGDRLVEVNGSNVESANREDIIELIKNSAGAVKLKVQPIPELSELSMRSGIDGGSVSIEKQSQTGTLQRSGSMRYKSKMAKSEDQLESERAWLNAEKVWLVHKGGFTSGRVLKVTDGEGELPEGRCKVRLDYNSQVIEVDEEDVEKANPPQYDRIEDLASLRYLNESSILHTMRQRYGSNLIHTYGGHTLLVVNPMHPLSIYSEKVIQMFRGCKPEDMPPHIYAAAQMAYRNMVATRLDQSIILMGRSGSGKTANARHMLTYLTAAAGTVNGLLTVEKLHGIFTLLDAFGNARTILNTSATKYTQIISLDFDHAGQIAAGSIQFLMLERTRITRRPEGEPTFHVFYQMLAGIDSQLRTELQLQNLTEPNMFMTPLQRGPSEEQVEDRQRATAAWAKIHHALQLIGVTESEEKAIISCLAAIYHLGVAAVAKGANNKFQFGRPAAAQRAATVLGTSVEELSRAIFTPNLQTGNRSPYRSPAGGDKGTPAGETIHGLEALEGFVVGLYSELFSALISLINRSLSSNYRTICSILVLDTPGFQNPASCGRNTGGTFEDLCHNYTQERLQLLFHDTVFTAQQDLYAQESIECDFDMVTSSPLPVVQLIDQPPQQNVMRGHDVDEKDQRGLLWLLDEEAIFPGSSDASFQERLFKHHGAQTEKQPRIAGKRGTNLLKKGAHKSHFVLNHFQGTNPVIYNCKGWLRACRENPVARTVNVFLQDSHKPELSQLFTTVRGPMSTIVGGSVAGIEGSSSLRRASSIRRSYTSGAAGLKRKSICLQVKFQVDSVIDTLRKTRMHFVHCILPQHNAGLCDLRSAHLTPNKTGTSEDIMMNVPLVRAQLRGSEIPEAIRIHRQGFPEHILFAECRQRFEVLAAATEGKPLSSILDDKQAVEQLLIRLEVDKSTYRLGLSQVFFRAGGLGQLEDSRDEKITGTIVAFQAYCRGYLGRQKLKKLKVQHLAVTCIQRNVSKFMAIREWSWWRLYTKIQPLLNVHRTEEELRDREVELEQLKSRLEKAEKERNDFKHHIDKLETKLSEMTADFQEEHSTSTNATELLETETAQRMKLEKDLKELQGKHTSLQRKHEVTEMDLIQARMLAVSLDGELDEDDIDGDSIYRERYERAKRELDFMKKKSNQQREEDVEQHESAKKQLERKVIEQMEDADEQRRQVGNLKRKSQRLNADMQDVKLHLEEQVSRNAELEKKQRKFDTELMKMANLLKEEKAQKDKLQREREELSTEKYTVEQELKNLKLDLELQTDKIARLERELQDMSSVGNKDDKEVMMLKRAKADLDAKLQDQEEELDDQAATIQQLEQTKLRLEMAQEKLRQTHVRELEEKEQELEEMRASTQKKLRTLEAQLEEEYEEKQNALKDKRELDRKISMISEQAPIANRETEKRLRRDLKRTRALLQDAQMMLDKQKEGAGNRATIKQLRNQLEDAEFATAAAVKARKGLEMEIQDVQQQLDDVSKSKQESEDRYMALQREKNDLQSQLDENEEDIADIMKKYKAVVQQQSVDSITILDQSKQIEELLLEKELLKEQVASLQSQLEYLQASTVDKQATMRLETKLRDLESRLELEHTSRHRAEVQLARFKDQVEKVTSEKEKLALGEQAHQEEKKRLQRQIRDAKDELGETQRREAELSQRKHDLENKCESLESSNEQTQSDLRLAFKRIADLQNVIEDEMDSDIDDSEYSDEDDIDGTETEESDDDYDAFLVNHKNSSIARRSASSAGSAAGDSMSSSLNRSTTNESLEVSQNGDALVEER